MASGEPNWVLMSTALAVHEEQLAEHGGSVGVRDTALLVPVLTPPRYLHAYGETSIVAMAATLAYGIAQNHPFIDGNKRTSFVAAELFLQLNGYFLMATDEDCISTFLCLAAGDLTEAQLTAWFLERARRMGDSP